MMDSGLCLLKLLVVMYDRGVYCGAVVNKRRYWLEGIYGDQINATLRKMDENGCHSGNWKGVDFYFF